MWKYLVMFAVVFGLAVYVARQDERAAQQATRKATQLNKDAVSAKTNEEHPQENVGDTERQTPSWYGFFRWPNGTTTWAIILTLLAIAEQTSQTAKAAKATEFAAKAADMNAKAFISSERAWILVKMMPTFPRRKSDDGYDFTWENGTPLTQQDILGMKHLVPETVGYIAKNYGRTPGWVTSHWCDAKIVPTMNGLPAKPDYFSRRGSISIETCDDLYVPDGDRKNKILIPFADLIPVARREQFLYVYGIITYRDAWDSPPHETRFCFYWHVPPQGDINPRDFCQEGPAGYNGQT